MEVALKLVHEFAAFLGEIDLDLLRLAALHGDVDSSYHRRHYDCQNGAHDHEFDHGEASLQCD
jgi:hypothetical protein